VSERLLSWGYVALLVDSFTTRSIDQACTEEKRAAEEINIAKRTFDAYGALLFLARQPFVDRRRVAVMGISQGGMVTLSVVEERTFELFVNPDNLAFRAAVALYPPCQRPALDRAYLPSFSWVNSMTGHRPRTARGRLRAGETRDHRFN